MPCCYTAPLNYSVVLIVGSGKWRKCPLFRSAQWQEKDRKMWEMQLSVQNIRPCKTADMLSVATTINFLAKSQSGEVSFAEGNRFIKNAYSIKKVRRMTNYIKSGRGKAQFLSHSKSGIMYPNEHRRNLLKINGIREKLAKNRRPKKKVGRGGVQCGSRYSCSHKSDALWTS